MQNLSEKSQIAAEAKPAQAPTVALNCPNYGKTVTGLVTFFFEIRKGSGSSDGSRYKLLVTAGSSPIPIFTKEIDFTEPVVSFWLALNSHQFPNGPSTLMFSLKDENGNSIWQASVPLQIANVGRLAETVKKSVRRFKSPIIVDGACDSTHYDYADESIIPWFDRNDALQHIEDRLVMGEISESDAVSLEQFVVDGYMILPDAIDPSRVQQINQELDDAIAKKVEGYEYGSSQRIHQLHQQYPAIRELWRDANILRMLGLIFEAPPRPCQSLTYIFGSEQYPHQDTIFLTPFPAGYMCGVWTALEDIQPDSGELEFYRGSHRLPRVYMNDVRCSKVKDDDWAEFQSKILPVWQKMLAAAQLEKIVYRPKAGTALIWHENLMHGGSVRIDKSRARRSIVSHHFADGAIAYYDSTGHIGHMEPRENLGIAETASAS